jgi:hypothetical protein
MFMRQLVTIGSLVVVGFGVVAAVAADEPKRDQAIYVDDFRDPVIQEMEQANEVRVRRPAQDRGAHRAYRDAEKAQP